MKSREYMNNKDMNRWNLFRTLDPNKKMNKICDTLTGLLINILFRNT